jgi:hypothetical protein
MPRETNGRNSTAKTIGVAAAIIGLFLGILIFVMDGFRGEVTDVRADTQQLQTACSDREARLRVLEDNMREIRADLKEIKRAVK